MSKNYIKKTLAGIFAVALVASSTPLSPFAPMLDSISITASAAVAPDEDFVIDDDGTIKQYKGAGGDVEIPSTIGGVDVTGIGGNAFEGCETLISITLPDSVTSIGNYAFAECTNLKSIILPDSLTVIGEYAFYACHSLSRVTLPDTITSIDSTAFYDSNETIFIQPCTTKDNGILTDYLINIVGTGIKWIHEFEGGVCKHCSTESIVTGSCGTDAEYKFDYETGLLTITGTGAVSESAFDCVDADAKEREFAHNVKEIVFEGEITELELWAFYGLTSLEKITLPDSLTTIGRGAFEWCRELSSLTIPDSVTLIDSSAFGSNESLTDITAPCTLIDNEDLADDVRRNNTSVTWKHTFDENNTCTKCGVNKIVSGSCGPMDSVTGEYSDSAEYTFDYETGILSITGTGAIAGSTEYCAFSTYMGLDKEKAFAPYIKSVVIEDGITEIGIGAFFYCMLLKNITIPDSVTSIGEYAFSACIGLTEVTIPDSVTSIGEQAFADCESLTSITIPASVTSIGKEAFCYCGLESVTFECADKDAIESFDYTSSNSIFWDCSKLEAIYVPAGCAEAYKNSAGYQAALGEYIDKIVEMPTLKGYSVSYNGDVTINFHYSVADKFKGGYVEFSDGTKVSASNAVKDTNGNCVFPISISAKNMYDEITAQFYDANDVAVGDAVTFDLVTYMDEVKEYDPNYTNFVDSFLEYGRQAATYFGVTGAPAGKTYSDSDFASISNTLEANYASTDNMGDTFVGATLLLKSTPKLRLYYSETFTGAEQNELNPNLFYTEKEISPVKFGTEDLNGYYVYNYIYKAMNSNDASLKALCAALYNMSKAIPTVG